MYTKINILTFSNQNREKFKRDIAERPYGCARCGRGANYSKNRLDQYLLEFQRLAGKHKLPYPIALDYEWFCTKSEEVEVKHLFGKPTKQLKETGDVKIFFYFNEELTDEYFSAWSYISCGIFGILKAL